MGIGEESFCAEVGTDKYKRQKSKASFHDNARYQSTLGLV